LVTTSSDSTAKLWDVTTGELIREFRGHIKDVVEVNILSDDTMMTFSMDSTVKIWGLQNGSCF
jgi:WD40 repeat protein